MSATANHIYRVRAMVNEPTTTTYSNEDIAQTIERYPLIDRFGVEPYTWSYASPPVAEANPDWMPDYDLNSAAADIWEEKAAVVAQDYDFDADGGRYSRSQVYEQYMRHARYYRSKRNMRGVRLLVDTGRRLPLAVNVNDPYA